MFKLYFLIELLIMPVFLYNRNTFRKGLLLGCFTALLFAGQSHPLLTLVPVIAALSLSCANKKDFNTKHNITNGNSSLPFFILFVFTIGLCYFCYKNTIYGHTGQNNDYIALYKQFIYFIAVISGPLLTGIWCDRQGPFAAAVFLCLSYVITIWITIISSIYNELSLGALFFADFNISGLFTIIPITAETCLGKKGFFQTHIMLSVSLLIAFEVSLILFKETIFQYLSYESFLILLLLLSGLALIFLYYAWKHRIIAVGKIKKIRRFSA